MATIYPPRNRNVIGERQQLSWSTGVLPMAIIDGYAASFSGIEPSDYVIISVDGGPAKQIYFSNNQQSAESVMDAINAAFVGITVAYIATGVENQQRLILQSSTSVRVASTNAFNKIGLPREFRNQPVSSGPQSSVAPPLVLNATRVAELTSLPVDIPNEATHIGVWVGVIGNDPLSNWGVTLAPMFGNGVEGEEPFNSMIGAGLATPGDYQERFGQNDFLKFYSAHFECIRLIGSLNKIALYRLVEFRVPVGATKFRLYVMNSTGDHIHDNQNPPMLAPDVSAAVTFGVRS